MPCFTLTQTQIELGLHTDAELLTRALGALALDATRQGEAIQFYGGSFDASTGKLTLEGTRAQERAQEISRAYGAEIVKSQAAAYGWTLQAVEGQPYKYEVLKY